MTQYPPSTQSSKFSLRNKTVSDIGVAMVRHRHQKKNFISKPASSYLNAPYRSPPTPIGPQNTQCLQLAVAGRRIEIGGWDLGVGEVVARRRFGNI